MKEDNANWVDRCALRWDPEEYLWLAPGDRDEWLEVDVRTFEHATVEPAVVAEALRRKLDGEPSEDGRGHVMPLRATRRWLDQQGHIRDGATFDICRP